MTTRSKLLTYWVVPDEEDQDTPVTSSSNSSRFFPKWTCLSLLAASAIVLCGLLATLWVWTRYGTSGFPHLGGKASGSDVRPGLTSLLLGPIVTMVGVVCIIMACIVHEMRQRQEAEHQLRIQQVLFDTTTFGETV